VVTLDGSASSDPDDGDLTYQWTWTVNGDVYNAEGVDPIVELPIGQHTIELVVSDGVLESDPDHVVITILNNPPVADAGEDQTAFVSVSGTAGVALDGSGSFDLDGDDLTYKWTWTIDSEIHQSTSVNPTIELPIGVHIIELIVNDGTADSEPDELVVEVFGPVPVDNLVNVSLGRIRCDRRTRQFSMNGHTIF